MKATDKAEFMKTAITQLYSKEGKSISYISRLLEINRHVISRKIDEWKLDEASFHKHLTPRNQKILNRYKKQIIDMFNSNNSKEKIEHKLLITKNLMNQFIKCDKEISEAYDEYLTRLNTQKDKKLEYDFQDLENETWKTILGYPKYQISNYGRVKAFDKTKNSWYLLRTIDNTKKKQLYVALINDSRQRKNLSLSRLVAYTFVPKNDSNQNAVEYIDNDYTNCKSSNLRWQ